MIKENAILARGITESLVSNIISLVASVSESWAKTKEAWVLTAQFLGTPFVQSWNAVGTTRRHRSKTWNSAEFE